ncbi:asparaginase [Nesterenkonia flava]
MLAEAPARVALLATGGTISSRASASGARAQDRAEELIAAAELHRESVEVEAHDLAVENSFNFGFSDLAAIAREVARLSSRDDVDGVVVTHGTDTMEETAAILALTHQGETPVIITGAQRSADQSDTDGPRNLRDAVLTAASPATRGRGVMLLFAGTLHAGWGVRKHHTLAVQPFAHVSGGLLGRVQQGRPQYYAVSDPLPQLPLPSVSFEKLRVDLVMAYPGADGLLINAAREAGADGIVVAGQGAGNPGRSMVRAIEDAVQAGVLVAVGTRAFAGEAAPIYGGGGAVDARTAGASLLTDVPVTQARLLLALLLDHSSLAEARAQLESWQTSGRGVVRRQKKEPHMQDKSGAQWELAPLNLQ